MPVGNKLHRLRPAHLLVALPEVLDAGNGEVNAETLSEDPPKLRMPVPAEEILPAGFACPQCGGNRFDKETDVLDATSLPRVKMPKRDPHLEKVAPR